jgi:hypothetical protein
MALKFFAFSSLLLATHAMAYSTLDCTSTNDLTYSSHSKVGGARPFPGMITHIEEIKKADEVVYRKVRREECVDENFCQVQQPELRDIASPDSFNFIESSKIILSSEGRAGDPVMKESYAIQFVLGSEVWMLCESFTALYP